MKRFILAAALSMSGVAFAQSTTTTDAATEAEAMAQPSGETVSDPSLSSGPAGVTQQGTDPNGMAMPPADANMPPPASPGGYVVNPNQAAAFMPRAATQDYPPCSRTVTDGCTQTYERGVRRPRR